mmetsp:Transcript_43/g.119  ORF Transcript_43/g.119 Transcript_43/m.119 type:complete len:222 (+) Transcript_43:287-952(+)
MWGLVKALQLVPKRSPGWSPGAEKVCARRDEPELSLPVTRRWHTPARLCRLRKLQPVRVSAGYARSVARPQSDRCRRKAPTPPLMSTGASKSTTLCVFDGWSGASIRPAITAIVRWNCCRLLGRRNPLFCRGSGSSNDAPNSIKPPRHSWDLWSISLPTSTERFSLKSNTSIGMRPAGADSLPWEKRRMTARGNAVPVTCRVCRGTCGLRSWGFLPTMLTA